MSIHGHCSLDRSGPVQTGSDKSEQVQSTIFLSGESHAVQIWPTTKTGVQFSKRTSLETLRPSEEVETALHHASVGVRCELV